MNPLIQMLIAKAQNDPSIMNDPVRKHYLDVLVSGNAEEGQKIASNLCQSHGTDPTTAIMEAKKFFHM